MSVEHAEKFLIRLTDDVKFRDSIMAVDDKPAELKRILDAEGYEFTGTELEQAALRLGDRVIETRGLWNWRK